MAQVYSAPPAGGLFNIPEALYLKVYYIVIKKYLI
jgi:hypothetical protein